MDEHFTPLTYAAGIGDAATVADLLVGGADVDEPMTDGLSLTPLLIASRMGHDNVVRLLLEHGTSINLALGPSLFVAGPTPLFMASGEGHAAVARLLLERGAAVDQGGHEGVTPLIVACLRGHLEVVQLLSSHGASLTFPDGVPAERMADFLGHADMAAWLTTSRHWSTPLHHLTVISTARTRGPLRDGADLLASHEGGPTPLSLAQGMLAAGTAVNGSVVHLVLCAARPWSPATHELFPAEARERACRIMRVLTLVAWKYLRPGMAGVDFLGLILPFDVLRG